MSITLRPLQVFRILLSIISCLLIANIIVITLKLGYPIEYFGENQAYVRGLVRLFDFNSELNIPTLYSSLTLFLSSILLLLQGIKYRHEGGNYRPWLGLSFIFVFLAIDEMMELHERLITITKNVVPVSGLLYYAWVIPYGIGLIILGVFYFNFLKRLPKKTLLLFIFSGFIFISGAIVIESFSGWHFEKNGGDNFIYCMLYTIEELFEMLGVALFIYTLLSHSYYSLKIMEKKMIDSEQYFDELR
ncbi:hypothetical protein H4O18_07585 [Arenibacter sp. BSSL-BM3]|uniref:Multidrug transporter n=1 Tax=Arenibacter arenosicollis TaxID=2762274 RepID=A0ABR7QL06_9FLAO|nr:hypothetical protein [Arenibacter arenosicollis]MBC8767848.1 hypothetical protein [Arenibacter arenosicollis]